MNKTTNLVILTLTVFFLTCDILLATNCDGVISYAGADQVVCTDSTGLDATLPLIGVGQWTVLSGKGTLTDFSDPKSTFVGLVQGDNTFVWSVSLNSCISRDTVVIRYDSPTKADAGLDQFTSEATAYLNANTPVYGVGSWIIISGAGVFDDINNPNTFITKLPIGQNVLMWRIVNGICVSIDDVIVTVGTINALPEALSECDPSIQQLNSSEVVIKMVGDCIIDNWGVFSISGLNLKSEYNCNSSNITINKEQFNAGVYLIRITLNNGTTMIKRILFNLENVDKEDVKKHAEEDNKGMLERMKELFYIETE